MSCYLSKKMNGCSDALTRRRVHQELRDYRNIPPDRHNFSDYYHIINQLASCHGVGFSVDEVLLLFKELRPDCSIWCEIDDQLERRRRKYMKDKDVFCAGEYGSIYKYDFYYNSQAIPKII